MPVFKVENQFEPITSMRGSLVSVMSRQYDKGFADGREYERTAARVYAPAKPAASETAIGVALMVGLAAGIVMAILFAPILAKLVAA